MTGASSGIGAEFCRQLAGRGLNVVLVARRRERLEQLAASLRKGYGVETLVLALDLTMVALLPQVDQATAALDVGLLVNNAGATLTGPLIEHPLERQLAQLQLNCQAPLVLTHVFARRLVGRGTGGIINVCSLGALMPMPLWTHYAAAKAYALQLTAGLWHELAGRGVDVLAVCPGATATEFAELAGIQHQGMDPAAVVSTALAHLGRGPMVVPGFTNKVRSWLLRRVSMRQATRIGASVVARHRMRGTEPSNEEQYKKAR